MRCLRASRGVAREDRLQDIAIREDTFTPESITDVTNGLGMFAICKEITSRKTTEEVK